MLLVVVACFAVGFGIYTVIDPQARANATVTLQPVWTWIQSTWASIPDVIKGAITLGIPSFFAVFFAWTKNRAMQKLQETKQEATQQVTQLTGKVEGTKEATQAYSGSLTGEIKELATKLESTKTTLEAKKQEITTLQKDVQNGLDVRHRLEEEIRHYNTKVKTLQYQLDVATGKITPPVK